MIRCNSASYLSGSAHVDRWSNSPVSIPGNAVGTSNPNSGIFSHGAFSSDGTRLFVAQSNLETYQGIDLLLEAFRRVLPEVPDARLAIIGGSDADVSAYRERCAALGLGDSVWLAGPRPVERLAAYLRRATVLVSPRIHGDNTPMKVYSYLDSGRPLERHPRRSVRTPGTSSKSSSVPAMKSCSNLQTRASSTLERTHSCASVVAE